MPDEDKEADRFSYPPINTSIPEGDYRLVFEDGSSVVTSKEDALKQALTEKMDLILVSQQKESKYPDLSGVLKLGLVEDYRKPIHEVFPIPEGWRVFYPWCARMSTGKTGAQVLRKIVRSTVVYRVEGDQVTYHVAWTSPKDCFNRHGGRKAAFQNWKQEFTLTGADTLDYGRIQRIIMELAPIQLADKHPEFLTRRGRISYHSN